LLPKLIAFGVGLALVLVQRATGDSIPNNLGTYIGAATMIGAAIWFVIWVIEESKRTPAIERFRPDQEDLRKATPEILYLLEDGWGVKRIVDLISANYRVPPKTVYGHVMEVMSSRPDLSNRSNDSDELSKPIQFGGPEPEPTDAPMELESHLHEDD
jgi:hypothetical protein